MATRLKRGELICFPRERHRGSSPTPKQGRPFKAGRSGTSCAAAIPLFDLFGRYAGPGIPKQRYPSGTAKLLHHIGSSAQKSGAGFNI